MQDMDFRIFDIAQGPSRENVDLSIGPWFESRQHSHSRCPKAQLNVREYPSPNGFVQVEVVTIKRLKKQAEAWFTYIIRIFVILLGHPSPEILSSPQAQYNWWQVGAASAKAR